jgi:hypothetical protein
MNTTVSQHQPGYHYDQERAELFTESGQVLFIKVRDKVKYLLSVAGAFRIEEAGFGSWQEVACVDRMVELGELVEFARSCWGQYRVFTTPKVHNL